MIINWYTTVGHSAKLAFAISTDLQRVTNALYAEGLIPEQARDKMFIVSRLTDHDKASELVSIIEKQLKASPHLDQYLIRTCEVLRDQQSPTLTDIANGELCGLYWCAWVDLMFCNSVLYKWIDDLWLETL